MLAALWITALAGFLPQEPGTALQRGLSSPDPVVRRESAEALASLPEEIESWMAREWKRGDHRRQRSLLLASALRGTPAGFEVLESAIRRAGRGDSLRAYGLLLLGTFHPRAAREPGWGLAWARTDFERACFLAGLLGSGETVDLAALHRHLMDPADPALRGLLDLLDLLAGQKPSGTPRGAPELGAWLLGSLLAKAPRIPQAWLDLARGKVPELWIVAARRETPRNLEDLRTLPPAGDAAAIALVLYELEPENRAAAFSILDGRLLENTSRAWLWGAAGDLGLVLPPARPGSVLKDAQAAGLVRLALLDASRAVRQARLLRPLAREAFAKGLPEGRGALPAFLVLALAPEPADLDLLRDRMDKRQGRALAEFQPFWLLATGRLESPDAKNAWLRKWSRELDAGASGFLDREGRRFVAILLLGGTRAAESRPSLLDPAFPELFGPRDYSSEDEFYGDLAEFLFSRHYAWNLP